jgi:hypothetical protein
MIQGKTQSPETDSREVAIRELGIPEDVIDVLLQRRILGRAFGRAR